MAFVLLVLEIENGNFLITEDLLQFGVLISIQCDFYPILVKRIMRVGLHIDSKLYLDNIV